MNKTGLRSLDRLGRDERVEEIFKDDDGIWLYTAYGYCVGVDSHIIHEDTAKEVIAAFKTAIQECNCSECVRGRFKLND